eukprot:17816-Pyramimonas_sp.AAC.1
MHKRGVRQMETMQGSLVLTGLAKRALENSALRTWDQEEDRQAWRRAVNAELAGMCQSWLRP